MKKYLISFVVLLFLVSCTDETSVKNYAEIHEWDSYEITGYRLWGCTEDDFYRTGFKATKNGKLFTGIVCKGLFFKGASLVMD